MALDDLPLPKGFTVKTGLNLDDEEVVALSTLNGRLTFLLTKREARSLGVSLAMAGIERGPLIPDKFTPLRREG